MWTFQGEETILYYDYSDSHMTTYISKAHQFVSLKLAYLLYVNSIICILQVNLGDFWLLFLLILNCSFLQFCMPGTFCWDAKHCEFYFVGCWILLYPCKYSWALFWNAVKLLGNSIVEEQNSPPKMSLWHVNCFEQKQSRPKRFRKKSWPFPELPKNF